MSWKDRLITALVPRPEKRSVPHVAAGMHHFMRERDGQYVRIHLRVDESGRGLLIAAASEAVRLSPLGTAIAKALLAGESTERLPAEPVAHMQTLLAEIGGPSARYPLLDAFESIADGDYAPLSAPLQANLIASGERLREIVDRLWRATVPHVRLLCSGELSSAALLEAVEHAEDIGMIAGLRATATQLADAASLGRLADTGLDYVVVPWLAVEQPHALVHGAGDFEKIEQAIREIRRREMTVVLEVPLVQETADALERQIGWLSENNIENVEVFAIVDPSAAAPATEQAASDEEMLHAFAARELLQLSAWIEDLAEEHPASWIWLPPVAASRLKIADVSRRGPRAGGRATIRVEANGAVLPPCGPASLPGNLLADRGVDIWRRLQLPTTADPADPSGWATE